MINFFIKPESVNAALNSQLNIINCTEGLCKPDPQKDLPYIQPSIDQISQTNINNLTYAKLTFSKPRSVASTNSFYIQYQVIDEKYGEFWVNIWYTINKYELLKNNTIIENYEYDKLPTTVDINVADTNGDIGFTLKAQYSKTGKVDIAKSVPIPQPNPLTVDSFIKKIMGYGSQVITVTGNTKILAINNPDKQLCYDKEDYLNNLYASIEDNLNYLDNALKQDNTQAEIDTLKITNEELNNKLDKLVAFIKSNDCSKCPDLCKTAKEKLKEFNDRKQKLDKEFSKKITNWKTWVNEGIEKTTNAQGCTKRCPEITSPNNIMFFIENTTAKYICQAFCMASETFMVLTDWAFEFLMGAISTDTGEVLYNPDFTVPGSSPATTSTSAPASTATPTPVISMGVFPTSTPVGVGQ